MINLIDSLVDYKPQLFECSGHDQAAVALILKQRQTEFEILFIERAVSRHDPWSGQIALPGGRREPKDSDLLATTIRETREETALDLSALQYLGRLDDQQGRHSGGAAGLTVSCLVFLTQLDLRLEPNYEIAELFWIPLCRLLDPANSFNYQTQFNSEPYSAIRLGNERILWGLTWRFVKNLLGLTNPDR